MTMRKLRGRTYLYGGIHDDVTISFDEGVIHSVRVGGEKHDAEQVDGVILPGFVDVHVHGGAGADFMDGSAEAVETAASYHAANGTTTLAATTLTGSGPAIRKAIGAIRSVAESRPSNAAEIAAIHLEGPYLSASKRGAQDAGSIRLPDIHETETFLDAAPDMKWIMTVAPELRGMHAFVERFRDQILFSLGHSEATLGESLAAIEWGARHVTHLFNAMRPLHHREPGLAGAALVSDEVSVELIADGVHIHPAMLAYFASAMSDRTCLVTDAIRACGMAPGVYALYDHRVLVEDGSARLEDGTLAGSVLTMIQAVRNMVELAGLPIERVVPMATEVPARVLGLDRQKGRIESGIDADLLVVDASLSLKRIFLRGEELEAA